MITPAEARDLMGKHTNDNQVKFDKMIAKHRLALEKFIDKSIRKRASMGFSSIRLGYVADEFMEGFFFGIFRWDARLLEVEIVGAVKTAGFSVVEEQRAIAGMVEVIKW
jgi:hypothetical protein